jgi:hypothetical protein
MFHFKNSRLKRFYLHSNFCVGQVKDLKADELDYDNYWDDDIKAHLSEFVLLSKAEYEELLKRTGFFNVPDQDRRGTRRILQTDVRSFSLSNLQPTYSHLFQCRV